MKESETRRPPPAERDEERVQRPVTQTLAVAVVGGSSRSTAQHSSQTTDVPLSRSLPPETCAPRLQRALSLFSAPLSPSLFFLSSLPHTRHKHRILVDQTPARNGHITATGIFAGVSGLNALRSPRSSGTRDHLTARSSIPSPTYYSPILAAFPQPRRSGWTLYSEIPLPASYILFYPGRYPSTVRGFFTLHASSLTTPVAATPKLRRGH